MSTHIINVCIPPPAPTASAIAAGAPPPFIEQYRLNKDGDKIIEVDPSVYHMLAIFVEANDTVADVKEKIIALYKKSYPKDVSFKAVQAIKSQLGSIVMQDEKLAAECFEKNSYVFVCRTPGRAPRKRASESAQPESKKAKVDEEEEVDDSKDTTENKENTENKGNKTKEEKVKKVAPKTPKAQKVEEKKAETEKKSKKKTAAKEKLASPPPVTPTVKKSKVTPTAKSATPAKKATAPPPPVEEESEEEVVESEESDDSDGEESD